MYLGKADVNTYDKGAAREFLVSNGRGSYGFSTVIGANTRREHGLLVVRPEGEPQHCVLVSKMEETLFSKKKKYELSTNRYKDLVYPDGFRYLQEYQGNPFPTILFVVHSILLRKTLFMPQGLSCTVIKYELLASPEKIRLDLRPVFAHRPCDVLSEQKKPTFDSAVDPEGCVSVTGRKLESSLHISSGTWHPKPLWYENIVYEQDQVAGSDLLWSPGYGSVEMSEGDTVYVVLSKAPEAYSQETLAELENRSRLSVEKVLGASEVPLRYPAIRDMVHAAYHLIDDREGAVPMIYSGYPSVERRARETFVALPGLTLATGRESTGLGILRSWIELCRKNDFVMPSRIDFADHAATEEADAGLWFLYAFEKYIDHAGDLNSVRAYWDDLVKIVERYQEGIPSLDLECHENGLLYLTTENPLRHWMNGVVSDEPVVRRRGYLVEVDALWFNALCFMQRMARNLSKVEAEKRYGALAQKCGESFKDVLWDASGNYLYDWVDPQNGQKCDALRPNQILAVSLPSSPITLEQSHAVLRVCWDELYTTYGLRTMGPHHEKFKGRFEGRPDQKVKARFRGMAWTWLLGQFITAYLRLHPTSLDIGWIFMRPFNSHLRHGCLEGVAELFDGTMPYRPHGDVLSAASLGELLRVLNEDLLAEK